MKQIVEICLFDQDYTRSIKSLSNVSFPPEVYAQLNQRWPQFSAPPGRYGFCLKAEVGCQVLNNILQFLAEHGRTALWGGGKYPNPTEFKLSGSNVVEPSDLDRARYVRMLPAKDIAGHGDYDAERNLFAIATTIYPKVSMGTVDGGGQLVVDAVMRDRMLEQSFLDVRFRAMEIRGESPRAKPLWELQTDRVLPPHLPIMQDADGPPYDPETGAPRAEHEFYKPYALRWRRSEIEAMGDFDFARTCEHGMMFVSKRVYEWFDKQKLVETFFPLIEV